jgi:hypothetical protein
MTNSQARMTENVLKRRHDPGSWLQKEMDAHLRVRLEKVFAGNQGHRAFVFCRHEEAPLLRKLYAAGVTVATGGWEWGGAGSGSA